MVFDLNGYVASLREQLDRALRDSLPNSHRPDYLRLKDAMSQALLNGGKRLRPCLTLAACQAVGGEIGDGLPAACALEMIHAYSLVHDDLPSMDNDELRRGKPTCHRVYGEATAILAGDALLTLAFETIAADGVRSPERARQVLAASHELAKVAGIQGMVGGQAMDMALKEQQPSFEELERCHREKTAALFSGATVVGGLVGNGTPDQVARLRQFGCELGLAFQHADDIRDADFPHYAEKSFARCSELTQNAGQIAAQFGKSGEPLIEFTKFVERRAREAMNHEVSVAN